MTVRGNNLQNTVLSCHVTYFKIYFLTKKICYDVNYIVLSLCLYCQESVKSFYAKTHYISVSRVKLLYLYFKLHLDILKVNWKNTKKYG